MTPWNGLPISPSAGTFNLPMDYAAPIDPMAVLNGTPQVTAPTGMLDGLGGMFKDINWLNKTDKNGMVQQGALSPMIGAGSALMNGILGFKQYGLAKETLAQNKRQFDLNFGAQQKMTNSRLADRQAARVAANPGAYTAVGDYMKQYGI